MILRGLLIFLLLCAPPLMADSIRIKDLVEFDGVRGNDLVGYGLVVGLNGSGDGLRNAPFTEEIMSNILERLGVNVTGEQFRPKNVAAVFVTAELPAFPARAARSTSRFPPSATRKASLGAR
jgi:flagellar P-ring protein precursor FlgI